MTSVGMVVPTRGDRPYLSGMIAASGLPPERIAVVVTTDAEVDVRAMVVRDLGPVNIQRWWNLGIETCGADHVLIVNDDVTIPPGLPGVMSARLTHTGASACYVTAGTPAVRLTGWAFMLNVRHGVRPDERFRWYYGDDDLMAQARLLGGVTSVPQSVEHHHPGELHAASADLQALARGDRCEFNAKWG